MILRYHSPLSFEGFIHCFFDRMSQGTRGGVVKFHEEVRPMPNLIRSTSLGSHPQQSKAYDRATRCAPPRPLDQEIQRRAEGAARGND